MFILLRGTITQLGIFDRFRKYLWVVNKIYGLFHIKSNILIGFSFFCYLEHVFFFQRSIIMLCFSFELFLFTFVIGMFGFANGKHVFYG